MLQTFFREKLVGFASEVDLVSNIGLVVQVEHKEEEKQRSREDTIILAYQPTINAEVQDSQGIRINIS